MRITGGTLSGRQVKVPPGIIRPAMDMMRESIFMILGDLDGKSFLDLFTGSGIIALEAASRGAQNIEAVEFDPLKRKMLLENVKISPVRINCRFMPAELYIKRSKQPFDIIFCDPPFIYKFKNNLITAIFSSPLVKKDSLVLLHRPRNETVGIDFSVLQLVDHREYGRSVVDFLKFF